MLESFFKEITILSYCKHPNIVKLLYSSFNGTLIKEAIPLRKESVEQSAIETINTETKEDAENLEDQLIIIKRKTNICYCVLKLVRYGELYKILENTEKFNDSLSRTMFTQLIKGMLTK